MPFIALVIAYLGEKLRKISKDAHLTIAAVSAYLNEVYSYLSTPTPFLIVFSEVPTYL